MKEIEKERESVRKKYKWSERDQLRERKRQTEG